MKFSGNGARINIFDEQTFAQKDLQLGTDNVQPHNKVLCAQTTSMRVAREQTRREHKTLIKRRHKTLFLWC